MTPQILWAYQKERFPLAKTGPLLAVFSSASISVSAELAGRPMPGIGAFVAGFILALLIFFQMRVCDEVKDLEDDRRYRPDRPIPRGLISLRAVVTLGLVTVPIAALTALAWHPPTLGLLALVWLWLALMTVEFGVPQWLKARMVPYLLSHMAIMPLIDLLLTGLEWMPSGAPAPGLILFLLLSFVNGCVIEIGRKLWAPESEIKGVDSYSGLWGPKRAVMIWSAIVVVSFVLLIGVASLTHALWITAPLGAIGALLCLHAARRYAQDPSVKAQARMDSLSGGWVFLCYALAGFAPLIMRVF